MLTGPIPELVDYRKLANQEALLEGSIPVTRLTRLGGLLAAESGEVQVAVTFGVSHAGRVQVDGQMRVEVQMICQNCMSQFAVVLEGAISMIVVSDEAAMSTLESDEDGYICPDKLLNLSEMIEDELLLLVPMIPRHTDGECQGYDYEPTSEEISDTVPQETYRPFADLADVLNKGKKTES